MTLKATRRVCAFAASVSVLLAVVANARAATCDVKRTTVAYHVSGALAAAPALGVCRFDTGIRSMEPSFAFAEDGSILYQGWVLRDEGPGGFPPYPVVVRSSDGVMWRDVSPPGLVQSLDPLVYADERTGRIFSVSYTGDLSPFGAAVSHTDDAGESWITSPVAAQGFDGESIAAGPPVMSIPIGTADVVYYCTGTTPGSSPPAATPICSKSLDGGITFVPTGGLPWPVMGPDDVFGPWAGNPAVADDGTLYLPKRFDGQPELGISHDEGLTWSRVQVATNGSAGAATRVALADDGVVYYSWVGSDHLPYVARSLDKGVTWGAPKMVAPPGVIEAALPRIASTPDGKIAIVYVGSTNAPGHPPYYDYCDVLLQECEDGPYAGVMWSGYLALIDDIGAPDPIVRTGLVNDPSEPLFVGGCSADGACMANLDFLDVHFDAKGNAWGAYVDDCKWARGFIPIFTQNTPICGDNVGEGILGKLVAS